MPTATELKLQTGEQVIAYRTRRQTAKRELVGVDLAADPDASVYAELLNVTQTPGQEEGMQAKVLASTEDNGRKDLDISIHGGFRNLYRPGYPPSELTSAGVKVHIVWDPTNRVSDMPPAVVGSKPHRLLVTRTAYGRHTS